MDKHRLQRRLGNGLKQLLDFPLRWSKRRCHYRNVTVFNSISGGQFPLRFDIPRHGLHIHNCVYAVPAQGLKIRLAPGFATGEHPRSNLTDHEVMARRRATRTHDQRQ